MTDPADLGVTRAAAALRQRALSSRELVDACLTRIGERDGTHSHDGDPTSVARMAAVTGIFSSYEDQSSGTTDSGGTDKNHGTFRIDMVPPTLSKE